MPPDPRGAAPPSRPPDREPLPPWHAYDDREGLPAITLAPVELFGAAENDIEPAEDEDAERG